MCRRKSGRRRPAAIMINNIEASLPQWGISHAGIIYEAPVEGGITRMMAIFEDYDSLERIGSVRSCRDYFINYAMGYEAIYVHYGQSVYAEPYLAMDEVNNLSGLSGYGDQIFYRTTDRKPPHNAYISGGGHSGGHRNLRILSGVFGRISGKFPVCFFRCAGASGKRQHGPAGGAGRL